ncbi:tRNA (adenosine(37)-N6)-threonylcarbamoyltransferase complex transferase subunit TsaD [Marinoscillum sp. MHG1-6]|uniref:tRNA (adenosine(37)-N6)-threonylcarbamoyltransferase complex transferase subunit TsaD n=1 Tax=Marinoscillum sp. MHG1-6 TaxID=2959627 RepID=UPI00215775C7|nr:tRNA (adenosine(37)-N6)-threonylcarbamoyltransferase complex transferase subunit TsaD [Marinoscillum sp. MHG1-6]
MSEIILGIESSCDETAAAICKDGKIISNNIATQSIHEKYGGVVPELASRAHQKNIVPIINACLEENNINAREISAIAYTQGPGLLGALLVGSSFAKGMAAALDVPVIPINHMQAHVLAHFIEDPQPEFPFLCLTISGGHTQIVKVKSYHDMEVIGTTIDDAVGEAFDKCAKVMDIGYPGGPRIDKLSQSGDPLRFTFPHSNIPDLNYSFSGIKTAFLYFIRDETKKNPNFVEEHQNDLAASLQQTLIDMLFIKLKKAAKTTKIKHIAIAGGVSANSGVRKRLDEEGKKLGWQVYIPKFEYCTDNAAMVAMTGYFKYRDHLFGTLKDSPQPRMGF